MPAPVQLLPSSDRFHYAIFHKDLLMFRFGLHFFWICLQIRGLPRFSVGLHLLSPGIQFGG
jgi:hypothetical protein